MTKNTIISAMVRKYIEEKTERSDNKKCLIVAHNHSQFLYYCDKNGLNPRDSNIVYVSRPEILRCRSPKDWELIIYTFPNWGPIDMLRLNDAIQMWEIK